MTCFPSAASHAAILAARYAAPVQGTQNNSDSDGVSQVSAKKLAGSVHIASQKNTALAMVLIEELDPGWNHVLGSTHTDYQGNFKLKPARRGKQHYLRVTADGFHTRLYEVTLSKNAPAQLTLELEAAAASSLRDPNSLPIPGDPARTRSFLASGGIRN
jgi:hypothetical protein